MTTDLELASILETNRYYAACRFLKEGRREWALVIVGELLRSASVSGRQLALRLLAEMYPEGPQVRSPVREFPARVLDFIGTRAAKERAE